MKKFIIFLIIIVLVVVVAFFVFKNKETEIIEDSLVSESTQEKLMVEKYIRDNVKTVVPEEPVLGGSWYIISVDINPLTKTGTMTYEDGHIQGSKNFSYTINNNETQINLKEL